MIGIYDYTVILTYLSTLSAIFGMGLVITGHPLLATFCLLFCGLCDMFDGKVARTKKNRSETDRAFGIQIDSLSDVVAFGVLPAVMVLFLCQGCWYAYIISPLYVLAGLIRLAYFNVTEEIRQKSTDDGLKSYSGLPITSAAMIFPVFFCAMAVYCVCVNGSIESYRDMFNASVPGMILCGLTALTGLCFILPFHIRKPRSKELLLFLVLGILIAAVLFLAINL